MAKVSHNFQHRIPLAKLEASIHTEPSSISGIVALIWPYSSASGTFSFLLAEPDFRLRREKGQVLVRLYGSSAKAIAKCGIINGDQVQLSLTGVTWVENDSTLKTPGKGIDWDLQFRERVVIQVSHPEQDPIFLDVDHPPLSPEPELPLTSPRSSLSSPFLAGTVRPNQTRQPESWSSPAFLKRSHLPYATYFNSEFDPFRDDEKFADNGRNKKLKFGRKSDQWVFADSSPISEKELEIENLEIDRVASPIPTKVTNRITPPVKTLRFDPSRLDEAIGYLPSNGETKLPLNMEQVLGQYTIDQGMNTNSTASDDSNRPSLLLQMYPPRNAVFKGEVNLDNTSPNPKTIFNHETSLEASEVTTEQEPSILEVSAGGDITRVELPATTLLDNHNSMREEELIPISSVQERLKSFESGTLDSEATCFGRVSTKPNEETRKSEFESHPYSTEKLEPNRAILNADLPPSTPTLTTFFETENEFDHEFSSVQDTSSVLNEDTALISSREDPHSDPTDVSNNDEQPDFDPMTETDYTISDDSATHTAEFHISESAEEFSDTESSDAASDGSDEESPYSDPIEKDPGNGALTDNQKHTIPSPVLDRARSTDDLTREVPDDSTFGLDGSSYSRSNSVPLCSRDSRSNLIEKATEALPPASENYLVESSDENRGYLGARKDLNNSKPIFQIHHPAINAVENEKPFETEDGSKSTLVLTDPEIKTSQKVAQSDTEPNPIIHENIDDARRQIESNLLKVNTEEEATRTSNESQEQDQFDLWENNRHINKKTNAEIAMETHEIRMESQISQSGNVDLRNTNQQIERSEDSEKSYVDESGISEEPFVRRTFEIPSQDESDILNQDIGDKAKHVSFIKESAIHIINLESDDEDDTPIIPTIKKNPELASSELATAYQSHTEDIVSTSKTVEQSLPRSVSPDASIEMADHVGSDSEDIVGKPVSNRTQIETLHLPSIVPETLSVDSGKHLVNESKLPDESVSETQLSHSQLQNIDVESPSSTSIVERKVLEDIEVDPRLRKQLFTPRPSQQTSLLSEQSSISHVDQDGHDLPTPASTQSIHAPSLPPRTPDQPHKPTLIEKLKAMRSVSAKITRTRTSSNTLNSVSPWFAQKEVSQITHVSDSEGDVESQSTDGLIGLEGGQERDQAKSLLSDPLAQQTVVEKDFSRANFINSRENPPTGFRTSHSYFALLSTLSSHYNTHADTLAVVLASTPITRAKSGPRDYNQTLSITDPSLVASPSPIVSAQIFRPNKTVFPSVTQGDSILLRNFKIQSFQNVLGLLSTDDSAWAVFRKDVQVQVKGPPVEFGAEERGFAKGLWGWWGSLGAAKRIEFDKLLEETRHESDGEDDLTVKPKQQLDEGDSELTPKKYTRRKGRNRPRGRPNRGEGVVRHELRDGVSHTDRRVEGKGVVHELRDGTTYSDDVEPY